MLYSTSLELISPNGNYISFDPNLPISSAAIQSTITYILSPIYLSIILDST